MMEPASAIPRIEEPAIKLDLFVKHDVYKYLWLKYVWAFNPKYHCARCLEGRYSTLLPYRAAQENLHIAGHLTEYVTPYYYLCGVTSNYSENLHIAFEYHVGEHIFFENKYVRVQLTNAHNLKIEALPEESIQNLTPPFFTCRNFQFGWQYLRDRTLIEEC